VLVRKISLQLKRNARKGYEIYVIYISENIEEMNENLLSKYPILKEFQDMFPKEI
jgi:hypothetical protein